MSIYTHTKSFVASAIVLVCASVLAETPEALVKQALQRNPELNFFVAEIAAAKGAVRTAGTFRNPELSSEVGYKNSRDNSGGPSGDGAILALSFSQTFEYPGRIALRKAIANHDLALAELHLQQFRLTLAARVRTLAYGISSAQQKSVAAREVASRFQALSDVLAQRPTAGVTPQLEARIIDANTHAFQRQERDAALAIATALAELNQLCGRPADAPLTMAAAKVEFSCGIASWTSQCCACECVRYSHPAGRVCSARLQGRLIEKRTISSHFRRAVLLDGKCNRPGAASGTRHLIAAAAVGPQRWEHRD